MGVQLAACAVLLYWRILSCRPNQLWRDWMALITVYWAYTSLFPSSRRIPKVGLFGMAFLLAIYVSHNLPFLLRWINIE